VFSAPVAERVVLVCASMGAARTFFAQAGFGRSGSGRQWGAGHRSSPAWWCTTATMVQRTSPPPGDRAPVGSGVRRGAWGHGYDMVLRIGSRSPLSASGCSTSPTTRMTNR